MASPLMPISKTRPTHFLEPLNFLPRAEKPQDTIAPAAAAAPIKPTFDQLFQLALQYRQNGDNDRALSCFLIANEMAPDNFRCQHYIASIYVKKFFEFKGQAKALAASTALDFLKAAVKNNSGKDISMLFWDYKYLAVLYSHNRSNKEAFEAHSIALSLANKLLATADYQSLGKDKATFIAKTQESFDGAMGIWRGLSLFPRCESVFYHNCLHFGNVLLDDGRWREAALVYAQAAKKDVPSLFVKSSQQEELVSKISLCLLKLNSQITLS